MIAGAVPRVNVRADVIDVATGRVIHSQETHNLVVNAGLNQIRDAIAGTAQAAIDRFALGTGTTAVAATDTALQTEVLRDVLTSSVAGSQQQTILYYLSSASANGDTIAEAGLFNAASAGTMYARVILPIPIIKTSAVAVSFTWTLTWGAV